MRYQLQPPGDMFMFHTAFMEEGLRNVVLDTGGNQVKKFKLGSKVNYIYFFCTKQ